MSASEAKASRGRKKPRENRPNRGLREFSWARWPTNGDEDTAWRTYSCVPRSHSCERPDVSETPVLAAVRIPHRRVRTAQTGHMKSRIWTGVFNGVRALGR